MLLRYPAMLTDIFLKPFLQQWKNWVLQITCLSSVVFLEPDFYVLGGSTIKTIFRLYLPPEDKEFCVMI